MGSDDKKKWYALKERFFLSNINSAIHTTELKIVDFPLSNYRYYRIWINDKKSDPLDIVSAGYYTNTTSAPEYFRIGNGKVSQADSISRKQSYVRIDLDTVRMIDKVIWKVTGAPFYLRQASLYTERERTNKKDKNEKYLDFIASAQLNSADKNELFLPLVSVSNLVLVVENDDNPPVKIEQAELYQLKRYLTAWLKKGNDNVLKFGDGSLAVPVYDLGFFKDSIPQNIVSLQPGKIIEKEKFTEAESTTIFTTKSIIWVAIGGIVVLLGFMSIRLVRETSARKAE
jgi:hypothetical protein